MLIYWSPQFDYCPPIGFYEEIFYGIVTVISSLMFMFLKFLILIS